MVTLIGWLSLDLQEATEQVWQELSGLPRWSYYGRRFVHEAAHLTFCVSSIQ
jgi:hypothetical protein